MTTDISCEDIEPNPYCHCPRCEKAKNPDAEKLNKLADWLDRYDAKRNVFENDDVQKDLRRIAADLVKKDERIAELELGLEVIHIARIVSTGHCINRVEEVYHKLFPDELPFPRCSQVRSFSKEKS